MLIETAYQQLITSHQLTEDHAQYNAVTALAKLARALQQQSGETPTLVVKITRLFKPKTTIKGLYFYGEVGRGKTMLMDLFYQHLPIKRKQRIHFHRFMESVHLQLNELSVRHLKASETQSNKTNKLCYLKIKQSKDNPLDHIAKAWADKVDVLCFDEFFVSDIGDAMLIAGLLEALFKYKVTLVATSNCVPEILYRNGLQREKFLPTIELINQHCSVLSINGDIDYRLVGNGAIALQNGLNTSNSSSDTFYSNTPYKHYAFPIESYPSFIKHQFLALTQHQKIQSGIIEINGRVINYLAKSKDIIAFDFYALCSGPRSQRDYIKLADQFSTILIDNLPQFTGKLMPAVVSGVEERYQCSGILMKELRQLDDEARRFIALVDEAYDQNVQLIILAEVDIASLYQSKQLSFEFNRCQSRLHEMQKL